LSLSGEGYREDTARCSNTQQKDRKQWTELIARGILIDIRGKKMLTMRVVKP